MSDYEPDWQPAATAPRGLWLRTRREGEVGENVCLLNRLGERGSTFGIILDRADDEWVERYTNVTTVTHATFLPPTHWTPLTTYCAGLVFSEGEREPHVVLMRKRRPQRDEGKLCGVGGLVTGEVTAELMQTIFTELAGPAVTDWHPLAVIEGRAQTTHYFFAHHALTRVATGEASLTEERITVRSVSVVLNDPTLSPTVRWLLPLALDADTSKPLRVRDRG